MTTLSPIFSPSVAMVTTSSPADGVPVREDPVLATEWMEGAGDLETGTGRGRKKERHVIVKTCWMLREKLAVAGKQTLHEPPVLLPLNYNHETTNPHNLLNVLHSIPLTK